MTFRYLSPLFLSALLSACALIRPSVPDEHASVRLDPHSFANVAQLRVKHAALDLDVDFDARELRGHVDLEFVRHDAEAKELVLDTRGLVVENVWQKLGAEWQETAYRLDTPDPILGRALRIAVDVHTSVVRVAYRTRPTASGLQWLQPAQTSGGKHPFLFSQSQAIHARSWVPLQDSPQVRLTYEARIHTPKALRAVMGAEDQTPEGEVENYVFRMPQAIPSYLIALAVGDLGFQAMSDRTGVYAEPSVLQVAAKEFEDTEQMIQVTESIYGPYRWGRYDLLILPPSFPYGGMENPRLTFVSPTVIAGDKSLVSLIAHELAHSWSGNLVTNTNWNNFWLNEGFTNHLTFRIMEELYGPRQGMMERSIGYSNLLISFANLADPRDHTLAPDISSRNPDEGVTSVPYNRGALFLWNLQQAVGTERFDAFLRGWFEKYAFQSVTTADFLAYLRAELPELAATAPIHAWLYQPELPEGYLIPQSGAFAVVDARREAWLAGEITVTEMGSDAWSTREWEHFLNSCKQDLTSSQLDDLATGLGLNSTASQILASKWFEIAILNNYAPAYPVLEPFMEKIGRMKLILPLYRGLAQTPEGAERARAIYQRAKASYHPIAQGAIERILAH